MLRARSESRLRVAVWHHSGGALRSGNAEKHLRFAQRRSSPSGSFIIRETRVMCQENLGSSQLITLVFYINEDVSSLGLWL